MIKYRVVWPNRRFQYVDDLEAALKAGAVKVGKRWFNDATVTSQKPEFVATATKVAEVVEAVATNTAEVADRVADIIAHIPKRGRKPGKAK